MSKKIILAICLFLTVNAQAAVTQIDGNLYFVEGTGYEKLETGEFQSATDNALEQWKAVCANEFVQVTDWKFKRERTGMRLTFKTSASAIFECL